MLNNYTVVAAEDSMSYEFDSIGPKGTIRKLVQYTRIADSNYYNLGFGDKYPGLSDFNDLVVTNNGDGKKVLQTVAQTVFNFIQLYPDALIVAGGSTETRTRLYRILISNNLSLIKQDFEVFGLKNDEWISFEKDVNCSIFLIRRK